LLLHVAFIVRITTFLSHFRNKECPNRKPPRVCFVFCGQVKGVVRVVRSTREFLIKEERHASTTPATFSNEIRESQTRPRSRIETGHFSFGGRSGEKVKFLKGPANSAVKSEAKGRVFVTNALGQVVLDITAERVKQVVPHIGFVGEKRDLTAEELELLKQLWT
jgi:hypothetical protein